jgi:hypothetical protein
MTLLRPVGDDIGALAGIGGNPLAVRQKRYINLLTQKLGQNHPSLDDKRQSTWFRSSEQNPRWCSWISRSAVIVKAMLPKGHRLDSGSRDTIQISFCFLNE